MMYVTVSKPRCGCQGVDLGHQPAAATHARTVVQCAEIAEHPRLRAWARSFQSLAAYWTGEYRRAADLARAGCEDGRGPGSGTITARLPAEWRP
ncbi:hypothetical protein J7E98_23535, partial [Streptomyces sp. ISL-86]|nr:hypothetical protein [Streptomyces sp. ISL-86]